MKSIFLKSLIVALSIFYAGIGCAAMQPVEVFTPNSPALTKMNNLGVDTFYNAAINTFTGNQQQPVLQNCIIGGRDFSRLMKVYKDACVCQEFTDLINAHKDKPLVTYKYLQNNVPKELQSPIRYVVLSKLIQTVAHAVSNYAQHNQDARDFFNQNNHKNTDDFFVLLQRETPDDLRNSVGQDQQVASWNFFRNVFLREVQVNRAGLHVGDLRVAWGQLSQQAKERIWKACRIAISILPVSMLNASVLLALLNGEQSVQDMSLGSIIIPHVIVDTVLYKFVSDKVLSWLSRKIGFQR